MEQRIFELELKLEHAQRDIEELKEIVIRLSHMINNMQTQVNYLIDKDPKSI